MINNPYTIAADSVRAPAYAVENAIRLAKRRAARRASTQVKVGYAAAAASVVIAGTAGILFINGRRQAPRVIHRPLRCQLSRARARLGLQHRAQRRQPHKIPPKRLPGVQNPQSRLQCLRLLRGPLTRRASLLYLRLRLLHRLPKSQLFHQRLNLPQSLLRSPLRLRARWWRYLP